MTFVSVVSEFFMPSAALDASCPGSRYRDGRNKVTSNRSTTEMGSGTKSSCCLLPAAFILLCSLILGSNSALWEEEEMVE